MIINTAGEYTLQYTATDACGNSTTVERELVVEEPLIYGVEWAGGESSAWTRTDKATLFSDPVPQMSDGNGGWTVGSSPFDDIMPWSGMQIVEDAEAGTLVKIPKFYYKWTRNNTKMKLQISPTAQDGFLTSPAHSDRGDGKGERDVVYVGRYHCSDVDYKSTTGVLPKENVTRANFRTNIHALGNTIWQYDFAMYWTICMLYLVEFADWNSQSCIGYGCGTSTSSKANEGATDAMPYHTGTNAANRETYGEIQYRHIEGLWSNVLDFVDGIYFNNTNVYAIKNPADFSDNANGTLVGTRARTDGVSNKFTNPVPSGYEYALYPSETSLVIGSDYKKFTCDRCAFNSTGVVLYVGGYYSSHLDQYGLFCLYGDDNASFSLGVNGSRLQKLP